MKIIKRLFSYLNARVAYSQRIARLLTFKKEEVEKAYSEINDSVFIKEIAAKAGAKRGIFDFNMCMVLRAPTLYVLCRLLKPEVVVETGVADGFSSAFILYALEANQKGKLYSIDLPNQEGQEIKGGRQTGWLVPEDLKGRWELTLGDSRKELPALCDRLKNIDIFYHDSDHSYENMTFEFNSVFGNIKSKGLIVSDDITDNNAFNDFAFLKKCDSVGLFKLGIARK
jgi:predicted O-methyltransferase YrrM